MAVIGISVIFNLNIFTFLDIKFEIWTKTEYASNLILSSLAILLSLLVDKVLVNGVQLQQIETLTSALDYKNKYILFGFLSQLVVNLYFPIFSFALEEWHFIIFTLIICVLYGICSLISIKTP